MRALNHEKTRLGIIFMSLRPSGNSLATEAASIAYVDHTGNGFVVFDTAAGHMSYQGTVNVNDASDLGGEYSDCSTDNFLCVSFAGQKIAVPIANDLPSEWDFGSAHFCTLQTLTGGDHKVWLVSVTEKGDTYLHFSYSRERGIETLSNQIDGQPKYLAVTYFLMNQRGLLGVNQTRSPAR